VTVAAAGSVHNQWQQPSVLPPLVADTIHIWRLRAESRLDSNRYRSRLHAGELERANRLLFPADRQQFIACRGTLRLLLSHYAGAYPHALEFAYGDQGKPYLPGSQLRFNLSHTKDLALFAFARDIELGIDVEEVRHTHDLDQVAEQSFAPAERAALFALPSGERVAAFYRCWTRKEALLKAEGSGLFRALDGLAVSLQPEEPAAVLTGVSGWNLQHLDVLPNAVGAIAWQQRTPSPAFAYLDCSQALLSALL
jgi:4'-phosphopantetheinyl transferase